MSFTKAVATVVASVAVLVVAILLVGEVYGLLLGSPDIWHDPSFGLRRWDLGLPGM